MKTVAVLTVLNNLPSMYGLVPVILNQLRMLVRQGYKPLLLTQEVFNKEDKKLIPDGVIHLEVVPFFHLFDFQLDKTMEDFEEWRQQKSMVPPPFERQVEVIEEELESTVKRCDVVITQDIMRQPWDLTHNQAVRNLGKKFPHVRWLHWCHSRALGRPKKLVYPHSLRFTSMANSIWVVPNETMRSDFAQMFNTAIQNVQTVYHSFDVAAWFNMHPFSKHLIEKHELLDCDILCVWPTRIDHPHGLGQFKAVHFFGCLNKLRKAKLVFLNSWSNCDKARQTISELREEADKWALPQENLVFSSEEGAEWELGVPPHIVRDLMWIANIFILPSNSETFSMAMVEASACKNLCVLNDDLEVMHELCGDSPFYVPWAANVARNYNPSPDAFFMHKAKEFVKFFDGNSVLQQHKRILRITNPDWVWKNQLKPLLEG